MLNYLFFLKSQERKQFKSALSYYGLGLDDLERDVAKKILAYIHSHVGKVSKKYQLPAASVLDQVITPATWATAYALLGASRIVEIDPTFHENLDEVELELVLHLSGDIESQQSIYRQIFSVLLTSAACHQEILAFQRNQKIAYQFLGPQDYGTL
jgi:hypothetical protein